MPHVQKSRKPYTAMDSEEMVVSRRTGQHSGIRAYDIDRDGQLDVFIASHHRQYTIYVPKMIRGMGQFLEQYEEGQIDDVKSLRLVSRKPTWAQSFQNHYQAATAMLASAKEVFIVRTRQKGMIHDPLRVGDKSCGVRQFRDLMFIQIDCDSGNTDIQFSEFPKDVEDKIKKTDLAKAK